ncbi:SMC-Scp complex subunit ScpB, partial [Mycobacterium tuberculosis]|nr:SMC-Scp complex subunit ScpB [Mycobacterium tuberculosis]
VDSGGRALGTARAEQRISAAEGADHSRVVLGHCGGGTDVAAVLDRLVADYAGRGVHLVPVAGKWMFRTATDLGFTVARSLEEARKPSRAAMETLAIIAYHQPVTRAEIEAIRGVATSRGTLDVLLEAGWIKVRGRRRSPGRPVTWG